MRLKLLPILLLSAVAGLTACKPKQEEATTPPPAAATEDDKAFYALGVLISENVKSFELTDAELARVQKGFADSIQNKTLEVEKAEDFQDKLREMQLARSADAGKAFLDKAASEPGAVKTDSGIVIKEIKPGTGANPTATDQVKVHYHGTFPDGKVFDSSVERKEPITFSLSGVIPCWTEAVQHIKVGGKSRIVCPSNLAYGEAGRPGIPPNATLIFEVELLDIVK